MLALLSKPFSSRDVSTRSVIAAKSRGLILRLPGATKLVVCLSQLEVGTGSRKVGWLIARCSISDGSFRLSQFHLSSSETVIADPFAYPCVRA